MTESNFTLYFILLKMMVMCKFNEAYEWTDIFIKADAENIRNELNNCIGRIKYKNADYTYKVMKDNPSAPITGAFLNVCIQYIHPDWKSHTFAQFKRTYKDNVNSFKAKNKDDKTSISIWAQSLSKELTKGYKEEILFELDTGIKCPPEKVKSISKILKDYNDKDDIENGLVKALEYYTTCGPEMPILRWLFRFKMRKGSFGDVKKIINEQLLPKIHTDIRLEQFIKIFQAECEFRYGLLFRLQGNVFLNSIDKSIEFLVSAPLPDINYHYWYGRCLLEQWYFSKHNPFLKESLSHFDQINENKWWVDCYHCIVLKLLKDPTFETRAENHKKMVEAERKDKSSAALKIHEATAIIILDQENELDNFIKAVKRPSPTDFESGLYHHIELLYAKPEDKEKHYKYTLKINEWLKI
jgi:hypothetical protein